MSSATADGGRWAERGRFVVSDPAGAGPRFLFDRLAPAHGRRGRWWSAAARRLPGLARRSLSPAGPEARAAGAALEAALRGHGAADWGEWIVARPHADDRRGRLTAFLFPPGAGAPDRVVKLRRTGSPGSELADEAAALECLQGRLAGPLAETVPRLLGLARRGAPEDGVELLVLSRLPGRSAYVDLLAAFTPGAAAARHLRAAAAWLARFHRATLRRDAPWSPPAWQEVAPAADVPRPPWHRRLEAEQASSPWPMAAGHGDFWLRNLLVREGDPEDGLPGVVDWEHHRPSAALFEDLFHFACTYAFTYPWAGRRRSPVEAFTRAFLRDTPLSLELRRYLRTYAHETGMDAGAMADLFRVFLLLRARGEPREGGASRSGGAARTPWGALYRSLEGAERSVFSG